MTLSGPIRLWIVGSSLWSGGWALFWVWQGWVEGISPIRSDLFVITFLILAPWLITASALVAKWVIAGFRQPPKPN
jgi:hypothetical protein